MFTPPRLRLGFDEALWWLPLADFALWATACGTALWPAGTFTRAYDANRQAAVEGIIEADPVAVCVRKLMAERGSWGGNCLGPSACRHRSCR